MDETKTLLFDKKSNTATPSEAEEQSLLGVTLKGRFKLVELIGVGGMGQVYKALDKHKEDVGESYPFVAIKVLNQGIQHMDKALLALQRETYKEQQLAHPNIVNVYDFDRDGDVVYKTMELVEGKSLKEWLLEHKVDLVGESTKVHRRHFQSVLHIIIQAARGLEHAHEHRIVHSDLKPGNIIVTPAEVAKLLDFGIARTIRPLQAEQDDVSIFDPVALAAFTPAYASYEMLCGEEPHPSDDIYALGCIFYELLTGKHPYNKCSALKALEDELTVKKITHIPEWLWLVIRDMLALKRKKRLGSASKLLERLQNKDQKASKFSASKISLFILSMIIIAMAVGLFYVMRKNKTLLALNAGQSLNSANAAVIADPYDEKIPETQVDSSSASTQQEIVKPPASSESKSEPVTKKDEVKKETKKVVAEKAVTAKAKVKPKPVIKEQPKPVITAEKKRVENRVIAQAPAKPKNTSLQPACTSSLSGIKSGSYCYLPLSKNNEIKMRVIKNDQHIFALSENLVSMKDYAAFCESSGLCAIAPNDQPVEGLSSEKIQQYFSWLRTKTGLAVMLPGNFEWQQALYLGMNKKNICDYYGTGPNLVANKSAYHNRLGVNYHLASAYEWVNTGQGNALRGAFFKSAVQPYCRIMQVNPTGNNINRATFRIMLKTY
ncbi:serine/threonine protein kinase [Piscirickettsia litoralis]|uniref:non-specific serine/threonine protein kinase n=1 Tax=Piscirickettsia litoralis TaxID=1891921 RepID=A0ABX3A3Q1_9GAMM|nr:protein kinase [Piscirickettsia litoralis]ODN43269.1 hypothetical protein BGC07_10505 [Piscirickettsia litoralis]